MARPVARRTPWQRPPPDRRCRPGQCPGRSAAAEDRQHQSQGGPCQLARASGENGHGRCRLETPALPRPRPHPISPAARIALTPSGQSKRPYDVARPRGLASDKLGNQGRDQTPHRPQVQKYARDFLLAVQALSGTCDGKVVTCQKSACRNDTRADH